MMPGRIITVVKKQAPTPMNKEPPNHAQAGKTEKTIEPNASIVVADVSRTALPVLEKIVFN